MSDIRRLLAFQYFAAHAFLTGLATVITGPDCVKTRKFHSE
jgi:hypothetical protein